MAQKHEPEKGPLIIAPSLCFILKASRTNSTFGFSQRQKSHAEKTKRAVFSQR
jgi:hypothetical protein